MEVTPSAGQLIIDQNPGVTAPLVINGGTIIRFEPINKPKFGVSLTGYTSVDEWEFVVVMNDRAIDNIVLSKVTNQAGWTNNLAGAQQAAADLSVALQ